VHLRRGGDDPRAPRARRGRRAEQGRLRRGPPGGSLVGLTQGPAGDALVIAIDGPAGAGKSTVGRALAERLGLEYLDTGAMYRAMTFAAQQRGLHEGDLDAVAAMAPTVDIVVDGSRVVVDGV